MNSHVKTTKPMDIFVYWRETFFSINSEGSYLTFFFLPGITVSAPETLTIILPQNKGNPIIYQKHRITGKQSFIKAKIRWKRLKETNASFSKPCVTYNTTCSVIARKEMTYRSGSTSVLTVKRIITAPVFAFLRLTVKTRSICVICPKFKIKIPEQRHWRRSDVFIVTFE